jgi:hypothetical protein
MLRRASAPAGLRPGIAGSRVTEAAPKVREGNRLLPPRTRAADSARIRVDKGRSLTARRRGPPVLGYKTRAL